MSRASLVSSLALLLAITLATAAWPVPLSAQVVITRRSDVPPVDAFRKDGLPRETLDFERFSEAQLDNLVGPVALYPDALLAQVLVAATFPDQVTTRRAGCANTEPVASTISRGT